MNESLGSGSDPGSYGESSGSTGEKVFEYASENGPDLADLRELAESGAITGIGGAVTVLRGLGSLRRGETGRGLFRLATGVLLLALAVTQRRTRDDQSGGSDTGPFDQMDVTGSTTDLDDVSSGLDASDDRPETDADPADVDTGSDIEDVSSGLDEDQDGSIGSVEQADVADTGPDVEGIDPDPDPGTTSQERADRSDDNELDAGTTLDQGTTIDEEAAETDIGTDEDDREGTTTDEDAGVSTESGEVGVEEETSDGVDADTDTDTDDEDEDERSG